MMRHSDLRPHGACYALRCRLGDLATVALRRGRFSRDPFSPRGMGQFGASRKSATVTQEASALSTDCEPREPLQPRPAANVQPLVADRKAPREAVAPGRGRRLGLALAGLLVL